MQPLSMTKVAFEAAWKCWGLRRELLSVMIIPMAAFLAIGIGASMLDLNATALHWAHWGCYLVVSALAAVSCHRVLLLGPVSVPKFGVGRLGARELRFVAAMLFLSVSSGLLQGFADLIVRTLTGIGDSDGERRSLTLAIVASLPSCYLFPRFALMLPSIAIESRIGPAEAWQLSKSNGWRLAVLIVFLPWLARVLEWGMSTVIPNDTVGIIANTALYALLLPLEIALLSVSYHRLIEQT